MMNQNEFRNRENGFNGNHSETNGNFRIQVLSAPEAQAYDELIAFGEPTESYEQTEILTNSPAQTAAVEKAIHDLLDAFNVNWDDPNYAETPQRVARAYLDYWVSGYGRDPKDEITVFPNSSGSNDVVIVKDMRFYSLCSHHLAPIEGYAAIAYMPDKHLLGLSKLGRVLEIYARRFQLQERIGQQTADALMGLVKPKGVMVALYNVSHGCMSSRGVKLHEASTTTYTYRGTFEDPALRAEALTLMGLRHP